MKKKIVIAGASGFIGTVLIKSLLQKDFEIIALSRYPQKYDKKGRNVNYVYWNTSQSGKWLEYLDGAEAVINLVGERIAGGVWTKKKKNRIVQSRLNSALAIARAIESIPKKPKFVIQASAIGYYGSRGDQILDESVSSGHGFLADLTKQWEGAISIVEQQNVRLVILRIGIVLGKKGGFLSPIKLQTLLYLGGYFGDGKQWLSWIHVDDIARIIQFILNDPESGGVFNVCAPEPVQSKALFKSVGKELNRPVWLKFPAPVLRLLLGEMANELFLASQRVVPKRLVEAGFQFKYPRLDTAFAEIFDLRS
jgi:uncharacterized protein (TIGR01777 family)